MRPVRAEAKLPISYFFVVPFVVGFVAASALSVAASRVTDGLVVYYPFAEGDGSVVHDRSNRGSPMDLSLTGSATWASGQNGIVMSGGRVGTDGRATKLIDALRATGQSSFEVWFVAGDLTQGGPARMLSVGGDTRLQNYVLGQVDDDLEIRLLHSGKDSRARPRLRTDGELLTRTLIHVVHTYNGVAERLFVNGMPYPATLAAVGDFSPWDADDRFSIGNEATGDRAWSGTIRLVAVYDRALRPAEVQQNHAAGPTAGPCTEDVACDDANPCNGAETCDLETGRCAAGPPVACDDGLACTDDLCDVAAGCVHLDNCPAGRLCDASGQCVDSASRVTDGLVVYYPFNEGGGNQVRDQSNRGIPLDLSLAGSATWADGQNGIVLGGGRVGTPGRATKVIDALQATDQGTFEMWVVPDNLTQSGPSRMLSIGSGTNLQNYMLGQVADDVECRLRHGGKDGRARPRLTTANDFLTTTLTHLAHTFDGVTERLYVNGVPHSATVVSGGSLANWSADDLLSVGNESTGDRPWSGTVRLVAIYDRALTPTEVQRNYVAGPGVPGCARDADCSDRLPCTEGFCDAGFCAYLDTCPDGGVCHAETGSCTILTFTDVTWESGTGGPSWFGGHGVQFADVTGDNHPDFYVTMNFDEGMDDLLYDNLDGFGFSEQAALRGVHDPDSGSHGGVWADLDNDGDYDLFNGAYEQNQIYRNDGNGYFTDVTGSSGLPDRAWPTRGVAALDMDNDGDLDLFAVNGYRGSKDPSDERNEVYRNEGNLRFTSIDSGDLFAAPAGQGVTDSDFDGDGDVDILAANRSGPVNILRNDGTGTFTLVPPANLGIRHEADDGITLGDVNNDGHLDLLLQEYLYLNDGDGTFTHAATFSHSGYMGGFADLDNDGDWDLVFAGDDKVYLNDGAGNFTEASHFGVGAIDDPRCVAFADVDDDGDPDFLYAQKRTYNRLIRNEYQGANRWLKLRLLRSTGQIGAFGAKVYVYTGSRLGDDSARITWREARSQEGYLGQNDPELHLGVGPVRLVDLRVVFPGGATVERTHVPTSQTLTIREPSP